MDFNFLTWIIALPAAGAALIALLGGNGREKLVKYLALAFTTVPLILAVIAFIAFDRSAGAEAFQYQDAVSWIPMINANYHVGVDGLSLPLVVLTAILGFIVVLISWKEHKRVREYFAWLLLLEASILGVFCALDLLLFFVFWEIEIIPMYFLIAVWGSGRKEYSSIKYVLYTLFGSALMLAGILSLYFTTGSLSMIDIAEGGLGMIQTIMPPAAIFFLLVVGFSVKLPTVPLHTWLPDAHTDAPTAGSVMLAGALIKMGGYGIIRLCVSFFPEVAQKYAPIFLILAVISILYGAAITLRQTDIKRLIAYSSVSHMGLVMLGVFALGQESVTGAALQMVSHGLLTGLLFAMAGLTIHNTEERDLRKLGGLVRQVPTITVVFIIAGLGSLGLPLTSGFAAEFITFAGSFSSNVIEGIRIYTILSVIGVVLAAGYILWMVQRAFFGPPQEKFDGVKDADSIEKLYMSIFVILIMVVGIYPSIVTDMITKSVPFITVLSGG